MSPGYLPVEEVEDIAVDIVVDIGFCGFCFFKKSNGTVESFSFQHHACENLARVRDLNICKGTSVITYKQANLRQKRDTDRFHELRSLLLLPCPHICEARS